MRKKKYNKPAFRYKVPTPDEMIKAGEESRAKHGQDPTANYFEIVAKRARQKQYAQYQKEKDELARRQRKLGKEFKVGAIA